MALTALANILGSWSHSPDPLYRLLARALRRAILEGDIPPGTRLPAERTLAETLAVSRNTIMPLLTAPGVLEKGIQRLAQVWDIYSHIAHEKRTQQYSF